MDMYLETMHSAGLLIYGWSIIIMCVTACIEYMRMVAGGMCVKYEQVKTGITTTTNRSCL